MAKWQLNIYLWCVCAHILAFSCLGRVVVRLNACLKERLLCLCCGGGGGQVPSERGMECVRVNVWMFVCSLVQCAHSDFHRSIFSAPGMSNKIRLVVVYLKICVTVYYISHLTNVFLWNCTCTKCTLIKIQVVYVWESICKLILVLFTQIKDKRSYQTNTNQHVKCEIACARMFPFQSCEIKYIWLSVSVYTHIQTGWVHCLDELKVYRVRECERGREVKVGLIKEKLDGYVKRGVNWGKGGNERKFDIMSHGWWWWWWWGGALLKGEGGGRPRA